MPACRNCRGSPRTGSPSQRGDRRGGQSRSRSTPRVMARDRIRIPDRSFVVDRASTVEHPIAVVGLVQRLAAVALTFTLVAGNAAMCAGWSATPEARMACCADGAECPMHKGNSHRPGSERVLTQAQADSCCALVAAITAAVLGDGIILPADVPDLVLSDGWRTSAPIPIEPVPKHVLLSVFLV